MRCHKSLGIQRSCLLRECDKFVSGFKPVKVFGKGWFLVFMTSDVWSTLCWALYLLIIEILRYCFPDVWINYVTTFGPESFGCQNSTPGCLSAGTKASWFLPSAIVSWPTFHISTHVCLKIDQHVKWLMQNTNFTVPVLVCVCLLAELDYVIKVAVMQINNSLSKVFLSNMRHVVSASSALFKPAWRTELTKEDKIHCNLLSDINIRTYFDRMWILKISLLLIQVRFGFLFCFFSPRGINLQWEWKHFIISVSFFPVALSILLILQ